MVRIAHNRARNKIVVAHSLCCGGEEFKVAGVVMTDNGIAALVVGCAAEEEF